MTELSPCRSAGKVAGAARRLAAWAWPLAQATAAAALAWAVAGVVPVEGHHDPFFAPIAAVVALSQPLGERGRTAVRLLLGVMLGIAAGELALLLLQGRTGTLVLATFAAMVAARRLSTQRIVVVQAAAAAILTVSVADGDAGLHRLLDGLIGGGVALVFSQILFSPQPLAMLRRAEATALTGLAQGLHLTADALEADDDDLGGAALDRLRRLRDTLGDLARVRQASGRVARRSAVWRGQRRPLVAEQENAGHLDLLGSSCVLLARVTFATGTAERRILAPLVRTVGEAVEDLSLQPGDRETRQRAADAALGVSRRLEGIDEPVEEAFVGAIAMMRVVAIDLMSFAGVETDNATRAVTNATSEVEVVPPPPTQRVPFVGGDDQPRRRRPRRRSNDDNRAGPEDPAG